MLYVLHAIWVSPCCTADSLKQSSRSPSTLPYAASRCPSSTSIYQEALGHSHLPYRAPMQDYKHDRNGTLQPAQHHVRSDCHSGEDIGWKLYCTASFTTALSMVMAELAKQVEVQCSERAHALALTWNLYSAAMDTCQGMSSRYAAALCVVYLQFALKSSALSCQDNLSVMQSCSCRLTLWPDFVSVSLLEV